MDPRMTEGNCLERALNGDVPQASICGVAPDHGALKGLNESDAAAYNPKIGPIADYAGFLKTKDLVINTDVKEVNFNDKVKIYKVGKIERVDIATV